jgi:hypothetical protein
MGTAHCKLQNKFSLALSKTDMIQIIFTLKHVPSQITDEKWDAIARQILLPSDHRIKTIKPS